MRNRCLNCSQATFFYLHSDGLTEEVYAQGEMFGMKRLLNAIADGRHLQPERCRGIPGPESGRLGEEKIISGTTCPFWPSRWSDRPEFFDRID